MISSFLRSALPARNGLAAAIVVLLAAGTLAGGYFAHLHGWPVTAAILAVLAVTAVGALLGLKAGVAAGLCASLAYNLLFTVPYLRFSLDSIDDLVPILALNLSAIASGLIAGRLHDRAVSSENAGRRVSELLKVSQDLQRALSLNEIETIVGGFLAGQSSRVQIVIGSQMPSEGSEGPNLAGEPPWTQLAGFELEGANGRLGTLLVRSGPEPLDAARLRSLLPILVMAVQRCELASEAAEAELLRRSEAFKTTLLSSVSHDVRTPLAAIAASASSLASSGAQLSEETRSELLRTIEEQCDRLDRLTTNLLNLGRIESGLDVAKMPVVDAVEVLGSALARVRRLDGQRLFERDFVVLSAAVRADEALLEQLFFNVLENCVVHTPPGTRVWVRTGITKDVLVATIEDDGPGIAEAERDRVFERFYQPGSRGRSRSGSGLGLSIAKGFVEAIGGSARARAPVVGAGARIDIEIPLTDRTNEQDPPSR